MNQLKEQIQQRDQLVSQLQKQLQDLQAENERQRSALYSLSDTDQLRLFHDARFIREFKARQQYLHEIEMAAQYAHRLLPVPSHLTILTPGNASPRSWRAQRRHRSPQRTRPRPRRP